jgi:hypothetical protein
VNSEGKVGIDQVRHLHTFGPPAHSRLQPAHSVGGRSSSTMAHSCHQF